MMQNQPTTLTLEQKFALRSFETQVTQMSHEQAQQFAVVLYEQLLVKDALYRELLKKEWGLDSGFSANGKEAP